MMGLLAWAWVFTLPGLLLTAFGVPRGRRSAGYASLPGPLVLFLVAVAALIGGGSAAVQFDNWLPALPDIPLIQTVIALPMNTTYWKNWPAGDHPYIHEGFWHRTGLHLFLNVQATQA